MKKILTLALVAILGVGISDAQLVKSRTYNSVEKKKSSYNRIFVGYDAQFLTGDAVKGMSGGDKSSIMGNGFNVGYIHGFGLSSSVPVYLEAGLGLGYNVGSLTVDGYNDEYKTTLSNFWVKVPVNVAYKANLTDNISLLPYTGVNFRINGTLTSKTEDYDSVSAFDEDGSGKRFQMGWQIGVGVNISKLYVGLQYGLDFMPLAEKLNSSNLAVNIGYTW